MTIVYFDCLDCGNDFEVEQVTTSVVAGDYQEDKCPKCDSLNTEIDFVEIG